MTLTPAVLGNLLKSDLDHSLNLSEHGFRTLKGSRILVTGGSGFVGKWFLSCLLNANNTFNLGISIVAVSRNKARLLKELNLGDQAQLDTWEVDLGAEPNGFSPHGYSFSHMIHLATPTTKASGNGDITNLKNSTINGLRIMVDIAQHSSCPPTLLHTSSGAVYGQKAKSNKFIDEGEASINREDLSEYGAIKLEAEEFVRKSTLEGKIKGTSPRLFAFFGPHLSYDDYAIGNFLRDAMSSDAIHVKGHPLSRRSYMYPSDLVHVLLQLLINPLSEPFNVGASQETTMVELASEIASQLRTKKIEYSLEEPIPNYYVPKINTIESRFDFAPSITLSQGIEKWIMWKKIQDLRRFPT